MLGDLLNWISTTPTWIAYAVIAFLVFAEAALFVGFVLPGETAVFVGGVLAYRGHLSLTAVCVIVVLAAIIGDTVGYEVGKNFGQRIIGHRWLDGQRAALTKAQDRLRERGGPAVLIGRFSAFLRAVMPALAGTSHMPYRKFLVWNATGGIVWGLGISLLGYGAGASYESVAAKLGTASEVVLGVVVVAAVGWWVFERVQGHRHKKAAREQS